MEEQKREERKSDFRSLKIRKIEFAKNVFEEVTHKMKVENLPDDTWGKQLIAFIETIADRVAENDELVKLLRKRVRDDYIMTVWESIFELRESDRQEREVEQDTEYAKICKCKSAGPIMAALTNEWQSLDEIAKTSGLKKTQVSQMICRLKRTGRVENNKGKYRLPSEPAKAPPTSPSLPPA